MPQKEVRNNLFLDKKIVKKIGKIVLCGIIKYPLDQGLDHHN